MSAATNGLQWLGRARPHVEQPKPPYLIQQQGARSAAAAWQQQMMPPLQPDINLLMAGCPNPLAAGGMGAVPTLQLQQLGMLPMFLGLGGNFNYQQLSAQMTSAIEVATATVAAHAAVTAQSAASTTTAAAAAMVATSAKPTQATTVPKSRGQEKKIAAGKPGRTRVKMCSVSGCPTKVDRNNLCFR